MREKTRPKAKIVVIDDHPVLRDGLMQLLGSQPDLECTGTADNTADARRLVAQSAPDLMILDLRLKSGDTLDLIKSLRVEHPQLKVLVLSQYDEMLFAERVLRAGASGYVMKENATDEILNAVRRVLAGDIYFSQRIGASFIRRSLEEKPADSHIGVERLSDRELSKPTAKTSNRSWGCKTRPSSMNSPAFGPTKTCSRSCSRRQRRNRAGNKRRRAGVAGVPPASARAIPVSLSRSWHVRQSDGLAVARLPLQG